MDKINFSELYFSRSGSVNVLGAGPSLFYCDPKKFYYSDCIYVNSSALILPEKYEGDSWKIWMSVDSLCLKWSYFWDNVVKSNCMKFVGFDFCKYSDHISKYGFKYFDIKKELNNNLYDDKLIGINSLLAAIELAIKIGYKEIRLYGVDQRFAQGKSHFWQFYPPYKQPKFIVGKNVSLKEQKKKFDESKRYFELLNKISQNKNVKIYNCSKRLSALEIFEKI